MKLVWQAVVIELTCVRVSAYTGGLKTRAAVRLELNQESGNIFFFGC